MYIINHKSCCIVLFKYTHNSWDQLDKARSDLFRDFYDSCDRHVDSGIFTFRRFLETTSILENRCIFIICDPRDEMFFRGILLENSHLFKNGIDLTLCVPIVFLMFDYVPWIVTISRSI